jgi:hypothetical protein
VIGYRGVHGVMVHTRARYLSWPFPFDSANILTEKQEKQNDINALQKIPKQTEKMHSPKIQIQRLTNLDIYTSYTQNSLNT